MITAKKNREMVNRNIADNVRAFAEGDLQQKITAAVAENKFDVKVTLPMGVDADALISYVTEYGYSYEKICNVKAGYDIIIKW